MPRLLLLLLLVLTAAPLRAGFLDWLLPKHDVQIVAVTDTTPAGAKMPPATPAKPVYYQGVSAGYRDFGGIIAGEKIPPKEEVVKTITTVLAKRGYLPADAKHPPSILLLWTWGTMNTEMDYSGDDGGGRQINQRQLLRFMGGYKLGLVAKEPSGIADDMMQAGVMFRDADSDLLYSLATEDLYVIALSAYDFEAATKKQKTLLWNTKISCPSIGLNLVEALPAMMVLAAPHIGRETARPVSVKAEDKFKPDVKIGDPTIVEYMSQSPGTVIEAAPSTATKTKKTK
jgi:hypothetical protein